MQMVSSRRTAYIRRSEETGSVNDWRICALVAVAASGGSPVHVRWEEKCVYTEQGACYFVETETILHSQKRRWCCRSGEEVGDAALGYWKVGG